MKKLAYFKIEEKSTPRDMADILQKAKAGGLDRVVVLNTDGAEQGSRYREKLLGLFRAAYRHKVDIYLSDDSFGFSGTGFGQVSSVSDLWQKELVKIKASEKAEDEKALAQKDGDCVVARFVPPCSNYPYSHYPSLTNPVTAQLVIDSVYKPLLREFAKFLGYELKGFVSVKPKYSVDGENSVVYSKEALDIYYEKYKKKADLFLLLEKGSEYDKYMTCVRIAMEENFILPIKELLSSKNLEYMVCGGENSASAAFCEKHKITFLSDSVKSRKGYFMPCDNPKKVMEAGLNGMGIVTAISPGVEKLSQMRSFFENAGSSWEIMKLEDFNGFKSTDRYILTNMENRKKAVCFLLDEDCRVFDWEREEYYQFEKGKAYTFYPYSFMCITKKSGIYTDALPLRVGGVKCGEKEDVRSLEFEQRDNKYAFYLPDEPLFGKYLEIIGAGDCIKVKLGSMEHTFISKPYIIPLYDFLSDIGCVVECHGGEITEFKIVK